MPDAESKTAEMLADLYEADFYAWTQEQAALLRDHKWSHLDLPNLIEEIESLGKRERQELRNCLAVLLAHLLKWEHQPQNRSCSWLATIRIQRRDISSLLKDSPSLKSYLAEAADHAYLNAKDLAMGEMNLPLATFPVACPYSFDEILSDRFYPGTPSDLSDEA